MTKYEIIGKAFDAGFDRCLYLNTDNGYKTDPDKDDYIKDNETDLDEYAKEVATGFAKWILDESILPRDTVWFDAGKHYTTEELFNLYLESLK